ncbi:hypothetical protein, partial [Roseovarius sp.]|uniref:hypothetical protein n=1 Tax=Roseovarius sp. TaxID=1486281 RepID=UPI003561CA0C
LISDMDASLMLVPMKPLWHIRCRRVGHPPHQFTLPGNLANYGRIDPEGRKGFCDGSTEAN